jgi:hypothetical protein
LPFLTDNSFKAAVSRTAGDGTSQRRYEKLVDVGGKLVDEIEIGINRK